MRRWMCVPMMTLCLLLAGCGGTSGGERDAAQMRVPYRDMTGCTMEAVVSCTQDGQAWEATLRCDHAVEGKTTIEVLAPETIQGVRAVLDGQTLRLEYEDLCLDAGTLSEEDISPMTCLPRLMSALRDGWLLEQNEEEWDGVSCLRITTDQSGTSGKILSTIWLRKDDGTPLRGEIAVDGEIILTAAFTDFSFYDTITEQVPAA